MTEDQPPDVSDSDVALMLMERSDEGLRLLLHRYSVRVKAYLRKRYGDVLADPELKEAFDEAVTRVWRFAHRYDESQGTLGAWFIRIAQRAAQTIVRREERHRHQDLTDDGDYDPAGSVPEEECQPPDRKNDRVLKDFEEEIENLKGLQKAIIKADLAAGDGGTADAGRLAELHGTTRNSILVSRHKAKENLHTAMLRRGHFQNARTTK